MWKIILETKISRDHLERRTRTLERKWPFKAVLPRRISALCSSFRRGGLFAPPHIYAPQEVALGVERSLAAHANAIFLSRATEKLGQQEQRQEEKVEGAGGE